MVQDVNECGVRREEYGVRSDEYGVRSETLRRFELFYRNVKEAADKRGDEDSNFIVWLDSNMVGILGDVVELLEVHFNGEKPEICIEQTTGISKAENMDNYIEKIMDEIIDEAAENPEWKAASALRCAKKEILSRLEPERPYSMQWKKFYGRVYGGRVDLWAEYLCPVCKRTVAERFSPHYPYCMYCGKPLDWEKCDVGLGPEGRFMRVVHEETGLKEGEKQ